MCQRYTCYWHNGEAAPRVTYNAIGLLDTSALPVLFRARFGRDPRLFRAPGRVNLIGEHTDYNQGLVMPAALDRSCWVAAASRTDGIVAVYSEDARGAAEIPVADPPERTGTWRDYVAGVIAMLNTHGVPLSGADLLIASDVPAGAGLSSSAALEVSVATALLDLAGHYLAPTVVAQLCQRAENEVVGAQCGIMDQYVACHAEPGTALLLDCRHVRHQLIPMPEDIAIVACNSMVRHSIAAGEYNRRRQECLAAVAVLASRNPEITSLRDATPDCLEDSRAELGDVLYRRARHIVTENERVERLGAALANDQRSAIAPLMAESHRSMRDDYEISCPEIDLLVESASGLDGVYGVRMTGGGFGGCTVNLVHASAVGDFVEHLSSAYRTRTGIRLEVYVSDASGHAGAFPAEWES